MAYPHERIDGCSCIRPSPHFLRKAAAEYALDLSRSFTIGDYAHDVEFARSVHARGVYVRTGHREKHLADLPPGEIITAGIGEAVDWILQNS